MPSVRCTNATALARQPIAGGQTASLALAEATLTCMSSFVLYHHAAALLFHNHCEQLPDMQALKAAGACTPLAYHAGKLVLGARPPSAARAHTTSEQSASGNFTARVDRHSHRPQSTKRSMAQAAMGTAQLSSSAAMKPTPGSHTMSADLCAKQNSSLPPGKPKEGRFVHPGS